MYSDKRPGLSRWDKFGIGVGFFAVSAGLGWSAVNALEGAQTHANAAFRADKQDNVRLAAAEEGKRGDDVWIGLALMAGTAATIGAGAASWASAAKGAYNRFMFTDGQWYWESADAAQEQQTVTPVEIIPAFEPDTVLQLPLEAAPAPEAAA
ncbi:MAG TPA: hypothetical protein VF466_03775 [Candidatus Saccharimonadales bacterium]